MTVQPGRDKHPQLVATDRKTDHQPGQQGNLQVADKGLGEIGVNEFGQIGMARDQRDHEEADEMLGKGIGDAGGHQDGQEGDQHPVAQLPEMMGKMSGQYRHPTGFSSLVSGASGSAVITVGLESGGDTASISTASGSGTVVEGRLG